MKNFLRTVIVLAAFAIGPGVVAFFHQLILSTTGTNLNLTLNFWAKLAIFVASSLVTGAIGIIFAGRWTDKIMHFSDETERRIMRASYRTVMFGAVGLVIGLVIAFLISWMIEKINAPWIALPFNIVVYTVCAYTCIRAGVRMSTKRVEEKEEGATGISNENAATSKYLDTSVIIDGRILDILQTGVIEGDIIIPEFVLAELRHVADSEDALRRAKGRRGLDVLNRIQKEVDLPVKIIEDNPEHIAEVDAKLLYLAQKNNGKVITNDFNLNKVAQVQGVGIININALSNAVKPIMLPGEELSVSIVREGRENAQGLAYLEDGTMIVVEDAKDKVGQDVDIVVTSALQTAAGRMIFAKIR